MRGTLLLLVWCVGAVAGCGTTSPSGGTNGVVFEPDTAALRLNDAVQFTARVSGRPVNGTWTSSEPAVLAIERDGRATALKLGSATVTVSAEGVTGSRAIQVISDYSGQWRGFMRKSACQCITCRGPSTCSPDSRYEITLTLTQNHGRLSGTVNMFHEPTVGQVTGRVDEVNHLVLTGTARNREHLAEFIIERWDTFLDDSGDRMLGKWASDSKFSNGFGPQHFKEEWDLYDVWRMQR